MKCFETVKVWTLFSGCYGRKKISVFPVTPCSKCICWLFPIKFPFHQNNVICFFLKVIYILLNFFNPSSSSTPCFYARLELHLNFYYQLTVARSRCAAVERVSIPDSHLRLTQGFNQVSLFHVLAVVQDHPHCPKKWNLMKWNIGRNWTYISTVRVSCNIAAVWPNLELNFYCLGGNTRLLTAGADSGISAGGGGAELWPDRNFYCRRSRGNLSLHKRQKNSFWTYRNLTNKKRDFTNPETINVLHLCKICMWCVLPSLHDFVWNLQCQ